MISKRQKWWLLLVGAVAASALVMFLTREREPSYQGRTLSQWLPYVNPWDNNAFPETPNANAAIRAIGTNGLPCLVRWLNFQPPPSGLPAAARWLTRKLPPSNTRDELNYWAYGHARDSRPFMAAKAFAVLGEQARPAIPELTKMVNSLPSALGANLVIESLASIGKDAVPALAQGLNNTNPFTRRNVADRLASYPWLAANAAPAVPSLVRCLNDPDLFVRAAVTNTLSKIAPGGPHQRSGPVTLCPLSLFAATWIESSS